MNASHTFIICRVGKCPCCDERAVMMYEARMFIDELSDEEITGIQRECYHKYMIEGNAASHMYLDDYTKISDEEQRAIDRLLKDMKEDEDEDTDSTS